MVGGLGHEMDVLVYLLLIVFLEMLVVHSDQLK